MAIQDITTELNIVPGGIIPVVHVSQYDIGRVLKFSLLDGTSSASIPEGTTADIEGTKPSNKGFAYSATISSNTVTVSTTDQMTVEEGSVYCKIKLTKDTQIIGTALFIMEVERAGINDSTTTTQSTIAIWQVPPLRRLPLRRLSLRVGPPIQMMQISTETIRTMLIIGATKRRRSTTT